MEVRELGEMQDMIRVSPEQTQATMQPEQEDLQLGK
jgi:hypothetical protein